MVSPGQAAPLARATSHYAKVVSLIPQTGHLQETANKCINKVEQQINISGSLPPSLSKKIEKNVYKWLK